MPASSQATTVALRTPAHWRTTASISPSSIAEAANLDLMVDSPAVLELAARQPSAEVAAPVEAHASVAHGIGDEARARQVGAIEISARDAGSADIDLASHAYRYELLMPVEHVDVEVGDRHADDAAGAAVRVGPRDAAGRSRGRLFR